MNRLMSRSRAPLHISNIQTRINNIYETMFERNCCCSRLGVAVSELASLVGVIYGLVGMCSVARRILSFLLGEKTYKRMSCLNVK